MQSILLFLSLLTIYSPLKKPPLKIAVLYFSTIDKNLQTALVQNISATYPCAVTVINGIANLPAAAYYKPRNRYRAEVLLTYLNTYSGYDKIIGITKKDISTTKDKIYDWGVMGLGFCPGKACVISTFRIKTPNKILFNERFLKIALHEIGHTIGLPHCTYSTTCFMKSAEGTIKSVDRETKSLCSNCKILLTQLTQ
jgi:archaemetzincin